MNEVDAAVAGSEPLRGATMTTPVVSARRAATSVRACRALQA
jgi:hypothetical protein